MSVTPDDPTTPLYLARVSSLWETCSGDKEFHATWFHRGSETVLGETSDPAELFLVDLCDNEPLGSIADKISVSVCMVVTYVYIDMLLLHVSSCTYLTYTGCYMYTAVAACIVDSYTSSIIINAHSRLCTAHLQPTGTCWERRLKRMKLIL